MVVVEGDHMFGVKADADGLAEEMVVVAGHQGQDPLPAGELQRV